MIDFLLIVILGVVTWCVASEGAGGAAIILISVLFSGLLAMNYFEPLAGFLERNVSSGVMSYRWDFIALLGLFAGFIALFRFVTTQISPKYIHVHPYLYEAGRWGCGLATGYITMAILLTALHTAPLPREFIGFKPERKNLFGIIAPDRQWLGFTQYVTEKIFSKSKNLVDPTTNESITLVHMFDGRTRWHDDLPGEPTEVFSSFIIRYASRREAFIRSAAGGGTPAGIKPSGGLRRNAPAGGGPAF